MRFIKLGGATIFHSLDNVATACQVLKSGRQFIWADGKTEGRVVLTQDIPTGHKFALVDIPAGERVYKYGEIIGQALQHIRAGEHVHVHNVESLRGRGDLYHHRLNES